MRNPAVSGMRQLAGTLASRLLMSIVMNRRCTGGLTPHRSPSRIQAIEYVRSDYRLDYFGVLAHEITANRDESRICFWRCIAPHPTYASDEKAQKPAAAGHNASGRRGAG